MKAFLTTILHWWINEIYSVLPRNWRPMRDEIVGIWQEDRLSLWRRQNAVVAAVTAAQLESRPLILRLAGERIWRREIALPRAAQNFLRQILGNEMDRRTPWREDQVYFDVTARRHPDDPQQIIATLNVLPRKAVKPALDSLSRLGLQADRLELTDSVDVGQSGPLIALCDGRPSQSGGAEYVRPLFAVGMLALVALFSVLAQFLWLSVLETKITLAKADAQATKKLSSEIAALQRQQHYPSTLRQQLPPVIAALDSMARALPDDAWAEQADVTDRDISVIGQAKDAASLLARVDAEPLFYGAEFRAPVTSAEGGGQRFHLAAHLVDAEHAKP